MRVSLGAAALLGLVLVLAPRTGVAQAADSTLEASLLEVRLGQVAARTLPHRGEHHVRKPHVGGELRGAVHLRRQVDATGDAALAGLIEELRAERDANEKAAAEAVQEAEAEAWLTAKRAQEAEEGEATARADAVVAIGTLHRLLLPLGANE